MITTKGIPDLKEPSKWSPVFREFVALCLEKDAEKRPSADELLEVSHSPPPKTVEDCLTDRASLQHAFMRSAQGGAEALVKINQEAKKSALDCSQLPF